MNLYKSTREKQKVAIYIRVSTVHQIDKDSLPMQRKDLTAYSELLLGIPDYEIFEDAGYSGKDTDRPAFQSMMERIRKGEFSHLLVWKLDRISRNLLDFTAMYQELQKLGVIFVSKNEQFDTSSAMGEAMMQIIMVFAALERRTTAERVAATMLSRAHSGQWNGGRVPFGYDYNEETKEFTINETEAAICKVIFDSYLQEKSIIVTTQYINSLGFKTRNGIDWNPTGVWKILNSPFYAGIYRYNRYKGTKNRTINSETDWVMVNDHHPAIISVSDHEKILSLLSENRPQQGNVIRLCHTKQQYLFRSMVYCGICRSRMSASPGNLSSKGIRIPNYSCPARRNSNCDNSSVNEIKIGEFVINYIANMLKAKQRFSSVHSIADLEKILLHGSVFREISHISMDGLSDFYDLLSHYKPDGSYIFTLDKVRKNPTDTSAAAILRKEKSKQERALSRLQNLYLYAGNPISEEDYIHRKEEITQKIEAINKKLGMMNTEAAASLSDSEFVRKASYLLIAHELQNKEYIYFKGLCECVSMDVLESYMRAIIDSIFVKYGHITAITFKNGLTHEFEYADPLKPKIIRNRKAKSGSE